MGEPVRLLQSSFATGIISEEVAARVDLQKYQMAVLKADNVCIRPYGSMYKRMGTVFCGEVKDGPCVLKRFNNSETDYMLEMGEGYVRAWYTGEYTGVELETPFVQDDYPYLRFTQSADVLYIATGRLPVKTIGRYSHTEWKFEDAEISMPPFMPINPDKDNRMIPAGTEGDIVITTEKDVFVPELLNAYVKIEHSMPAKTASFNGGNSSFASNSISPYVYTYLDQDGESHEATDYSYSVTITGSWSGTINIQGGRGNWPNVNNVTWTQINGYTANTEYSGSMYGYGLIRAQGTISSGSATIVLASSANTVRLTVEAKYSEAVLCGNAWKLLTHGTWGGKLYLERSLDKEKWEEFRVYSSNSDFNASDNGVVDEYTYLRVRGAITSGSCTIDLTALPYIHKGVVKLKVIESARSAAAEVIDVLGSAEPTADWYISCWNDLYGYPHCVSFFQDRLSFAKTYRQPNRVWFSKTADYPNFGTERVDGKVTDDSAIDIGIITRELFDIRHILPGTDFVIFTAGNEWIISGGSVLKPTEINPRMQTAWGSSLVEPIFIGNRIVYIQRRGGKVRDMGYTYESDNYTGDDLTMFIQHLTERHAFVDSTYSQQPDSMIYFVRDDGVMLCLTYMREQNVFAWTEFITQGKFESVLSVSEGDNDVLYAVVRREINGVEKRFIEKFAFDPETETPSDYVMTDCSIVVENDVETDIISGLCHLAGERVQVVTDSDVAPKEGYIVREDGTVRLPYKVKKAVVGLPYTMDVLFCDVVGDAESGTTQGQNKSVSKSTFKLERSFGGRVYCLDSDMTTEIFKGTIGGGNILNGDLTVNLKTQYEDVAGPIATNKTGRIGIVHDDPYPFSMSAVIREVTTR